MAVARRVVLATDYDRTFTTPQLDLSPGAIEAARDLRRQGVKVLLVTGRREDHLPLREVEGCFDVYVLEGGAIWGTPGAWHFRAARPALWAACEALAGLGHDIERGRASFSAPRKALNALRPWAKDLAVHGNADRLDVTSPGVDKGYGLAKALAWLGWQDAHVVCVGDSENDVPLFRAATEAVALGNAVPELVRVADRQVAAPADKGFVAVAKSMSDLLRGPEAAR